MVAVVAARSWFKCSLVRRCARARAENHTRVHVCQYSTGTGISEGHWGLGRLTGIARIERTPAAQWRMKDLRFWYVLGIPSRNSYRDYGKRTGSSRILVYTTKYYE